MQEAPQPVLVDDYVDCTCTNYGLSYLRFEYRASVKAYMSFHCHRRLAEGHGSHRSTLTDGQSQAEKGDLPLFRVFLLADFEHGVTIPSGRDEGVDGSTGDLNSSTSSGDGLDLLLRFLCGLPATLHSLTTAVCLREPERHFFNQRLPYLFCRCTALAISSKRTSSLYGFNQRLPYLFCSCILRTISSKWISSCAESLHGL